MTEINFNLIDKDFDIIQMDNLVQGSTDINILKVWFGTYINNVFTPDLTIAEDKSKVVGVIYTRPDGKHTWFINFAPQLDGSFLTTISSWALYLAGTLFLDVQIKTLTTGVNDSYNRVSLLVNQGTALDNEEFVFTQADYDNICFLLNNKINYANLVEVATYADLPATGETGKIYSVLDELKNYLWNGTDYTFVFLTTTSESDINTYINTYVETYVNGYTLSELEIQTYIQSIMSQFNTIDFTGVDSAYNILQKTEDDGVWLSNSGDVYYWDSYSNSYINGFPLWNSLLTPTLAGDNVFTGSNTFNDEIIVTDKELFDFSEIGTDENALLENVSAFAENGTLELLATGAEGDYYGFYVDNLAVGTYTLQITCDTGTWGFEIDDGRTTYVSEHSISAGTQTFTFTLTNPAGTIIYMTLYTQTDGLAGTQTFSNFTLNEGSTLAKKVKYQNNGIEYFDGSNSYIQTFPSESGTYLLDCDIVDLTNRVTANEIAIAGKASLTESNNFTGVNNFSDGKLTINGDYVVTGDYISNVYATKVTTDALDTKVTKNETNISANATNIATNTSNISDILDGTQIVGKALLDSNGDNIYSSFANLQSQVDQIRGIARSYGSVAYNTANVTDAILTTYVIHIKGSNPGSGDLVYDSNNHEWEFNGTIWVDNGEWKQQSIATDTELGVVKASDDVSVNATTGAMTVNNSAKLGGVSGGVGAGVNSIKFGENSIATEDGATAIGKSAQATGSYSVAMGVIARATGEGSTAMGTGSSATNTFALANGSYSLASGFCSLADGVGAKSTQNYSVAVGGYSRSYIAYWATFDGNDSGGGGINRTISIYDLSKIFIRNEDINSSKTSQSDYTNGVTLSELLGENCEYVANTLYVDSSFTRADDGWGVTKFNTIYDANDSISDNSKNNRYKIIVANGTYTDLQTKYAGIPGTSYQGIVCKDYVYYESEDINHPELCIINWDGATGYTTPVTSDEITKKCPFHIVYNSNHTHIKGFTFNVSNCRYALHIETAGATEPVQYVVENCVLNWGGRPDLNAISYDSPVVGTGFTNGEVGEFINCEFNSTGTATYENMAWQSHDNVANPTGVSVGETITFTNCYFSNQISEYSIINPRISANATYQTVNVNSSIKLTNCCGLPTKVNTAYTYDEYNVIFDGTKEYANEVVNNYLEYSFDDIPENADFSSGTDNWTLQGSGSISTLDNVLTFISTSVYSKVIQNVSLTYGNYYYFKVDFYSEDATIYSARLIADNDSSPFIKFEETTNYSDFVEHDTIVQWLNADVTPNVMLFSNSVGTIHCKPIKLYDVTDYVKAGKTDAEIKDMIDNEDTPIENLYKTKATINQDTEEISVAFTDILAGTNKYFEYDTGTNILKPKSNVDFSNKHFTFSNTEPDQDYTINVKPNGTQAVQVTINHNALFTTYHYTINIYDYYGDARMKLITSDGIFTRYDAAALSTTEKFRVSFNVNSSGVINEQLI